MNTIFFWFYWWRIGFFKSQINCYSSLSWSETLGFQTLYSWPQSSTQHERETPFVDAHTSCLSPASHTRSTSKLASSANLILLRAKRSPNDPLCLLHLWQCFTPLAAIPISSPVPEYNRNLSFFHICSFFKFIF